MPEIKTKERKGLIKKISNYISKIDLSKKKFNALELILIFIMALVFGVLTGEMIFSGASDKKAPVSLTSNNTIQINEIKNVYNTILNEYINHIDKEALKDAAINGMFSVLGDRHSVYFNEKESENFQDQLNGYFYGMGTSVYQKNGDLVTINEVYKNSPAEKAGLKKGDKYLKINGKDVTKYTSEEISEEIKGTDGKRFTLTIQRGDKEINVKIKTGKVAIPSVNYKMINKDNKQIGYIEISIFASNTDEQLKEALQELKKENIKDIIIDLRYNQGGQLDTVLNIASEFLNKKMPIVQILDKKDTDIKYSEGNSNPKYNIVVLINEISASASEVLAAALNEQLGTPLIGEKTYGKGTVQKTKQLSNGSLIKYTIETWKTSKGNNIDKVGIKPTIKVEQSKNYTRTGKDQDDNQLQKAIETIIKK